MTYLVLYYIAFKKISMGRWGFVKQGIRLWALRAAAFVKIGHTYCWIPGDWGVETLASYLLLETLTNRSASDLTSQVQPEIGIPVLCVPGH